MEESRLNFVGLGLIMFWAMPSKDEGLASPPLSALIVTPSLQLKIQENLASLSAHVLPMMIGRWCPMAVARLDDGLHLS